MRLLKGTGWPGRIGVQIDFTFRILSFVLHRWCYYSSHATEIIYKGVEGRSLPAIHFDKLALLVYKLWDGAYGTESDRILISVENHGPFPSDLDLRFSFPFDVFPGVHGPGLARPKKPGNKPVYIGEAIVEYQRITVQSQFNYFKVAYVDRDGNESDVRYGNVGLEHRNFFWPSIGIADAADLLDVLTETERRFVEELAHSVESLSAEEIRVLAVHASEKGTASALRFLFRDGKEIASRCCALLGKGEWIGDEVKKLRWLTDEGVRKSESNAKVFEEAYDKIHRRVQSNRLLATAVERQLGGGQESWRGGSLAERSCRGFQNARLFAEYLFLLDAEIPYAGANERSANRRRSRTTLSELVNQLPEGSFDKLPKTLDEAVGENTVLLNEARDVLTERLSGFRDWCAEMASERMP